jgi:hypothetical protein
MVGTQHMFTVHGGSADWTPRSTVCVKHISFASRGVKQQEPLVDDVRALAGRNDGARALGQTQTIHDSCQDQNITVLVHKVCTIARDVVPICCHVRFVAWCLTVDRGHTTVAIHVELEQSAVFAEQVSLCHKSVHPIRVSCLVTGLERCLHVADKVPCVLCVWVLVLQELLRVHSAAVDLRSITVHYRRLQSITVDYSRLQSITVDYSRLQSITVNFSRLQSSAGDHCASNLNV